MAITGKAAINEKVQKVIAGIESDDRDRLSDH